MMARRTRASAPRSRPPAALPVATIRADPQTLAYAKRLAGGDSRRLRIQRDGSIIVVNRPPA